MESARIDRRPPWPFELAVVAFLLVGYDWVAGTARLHAASAIRHAHDLLRIERDLHLLVERRLDLAVAPHHHLGQVLSLYYDFAHGVVTVASLLVLFALSPALYRRTRNALVAVNLAALVVFLLLPLAPPRLVPGAGYVDVVAESHTFGSWETTKGVARHANEYASMPSLHVAWATCVLLAVFAATSRRWLRALAVTHLVLTTAVILLTGNHYVFDALAGALLAVAAWLLLPLARRPVPPATRPVPEPVPELESAQQA